MMVTVSKLKRCSDQTTAMIVHDLRNCFSRWYLSVWQFSVTSLKYVDFASPSYLHQYQWRNIDRLGQLVTTLASFHLCLWLSKSRRWRSTIGIPPTLQTHTTAHMQVCAHMCSSSEYLLSRSYAFLRMLSYACFLRMLSYACLRYNHFHSTIKCTDVPSCILCSYVDISDVGAFLFHESVGLFSS